MSYERPDGRKHEDLRPITAKAGVIKNATGSGYFKIGNTAAYAGVYGPQEMHPKFLQNPKGGVLRCTYNLLPFAGMGDRVRPGPSRRSKEISLVTEKSLLPVVDLSEYPNAVVDVFIELTETDAGSRCAGICAAAIALADAGIVMKDMVAAVSCGKVAGNVVVDLDYKEEAYEGEVADIPIAMVPSTGEITLLQMDGPVSEEELKQALEMVKPAIQQIVDAQNKAIRDSFGGVKK